MLNSIQTVWEITSYEVWGNDEDGYQVNNTFENGTVVLELQVEIANEGTNRQFLYAHPSDSQLNDLGFGNVQCANGSDNSRIYLECPDTGKPMGMIDLESHDSLSPIDVDYTLSANQDLFTALAFLNQGDEIEEIDGGSGEYDSYFGAVLYNMMDEDDRDTLIEEYTGVSVDYWTEHLEIGDRSFALLYLGTRTGSGVGFWEYDDAADLNTYVKAQGNIGIYKGDDNKIYSHR